MAGVRGHRVQPDSRRRDPRWSASGQSDLLLSTLANYLAAAGATDVTITARLGDRTVEVALPEQLVDGT